MYPDLVSDLPSDPYGYLASIHAYDICVSTVGLHGSNPWKLAEYLAASRVIVSEPLRYNLPEPMIDGKHYVEFTSPQECVDACLWLLDSPERRAEMRSAAWAYWRTNVHPVALMRNRLLDLER
jgi:hypothetical protein